jgi:hypothetical protein
MPKKKETVKEVEKENKGYGRIVIGSEQIKKGGIWSKRSKVAICGFAPSSMRDVQVMFKDTDLEVWGLNQLYMPFPEMTKAATRWFQIHHRHSYDQTISRDHSHHEWMTKQTNFPIYMQNKEPDVPMSIAFPKDAVMDIFGNYFTNSISWMLALAIMERFKTIYLFGIDMAQDSEYSYERPSVEWLIGWARGAGAKVVIPEKSDLLKTMWLYPFEDSAPFRAKMEARLIELRQRMTQHAQAEMENRDIKNQLLGALDNNNYIKKTWHQCQVEIPTIKARITTCPYCDGNHDYRISACPVKGPDEK